MSSFCSAKATHIFPAKNIRVLYIESAKIVNEMTLNELVSYDALNNWAQGFIWPLFNTSSIDMVIASAASWIEISFQRRFLNTVQLINTVYVHHWNRCMLGNDASLMQQVLWKMPGEYHSKFSQAHVTGQVMSTADFGGHISDAASHLKRAL